ncbi:MAG: flagellar biosynthesis protein FlhA [Planctomycetota bacterium]
MSQDQPQLAAEEAPRRGISRLLAHNDILFACGVAMILATMLIPLPTFLLDMMLSLSIAVALGTLILVLATNEPVELSTFPSLLLVLTLFRLSLNVASTRLILLNGEAGKIIATFGHFVAGGNLVIGLVVFLILVIIQFVVITKGAERISEVAARFNLDAMPGKQMAIDADLNAGTIGEEQARQRREKIAQESEFYGAMDGASKFIRGDAVAGLIITAINLVGGFLVGMTKGMDASQSMARFSILAIGDGLVSQIPALLISTSSGFLISKTASKTNLSADLTRQMLTKSRPLGIAAFLLAALIFVPGFPKLPFAAMALFAGVLSRSLGRSKREAKKAAEGEQQKDPSEIPPEPETPIEELLEVDRVAVQVGPRLIKTVDPRRKGSLSHRISPLRRKFAQQYGIVLPLVRLRDNVTLEATAYEIRLHNHVVARGNLEPDMFMAMDPGTVTTPVKGKPAHEPVFSLPALWVTSEQKEEAEMAGYTVVDPETVLVTHLSETLRRHAYELLSRDDVQTLVDRLREKQPALVNGVVGETVSMGLLHRVLQNLLRDGIPVRDLAHIIEAVGDNAARTQDAMLLTEVARKAVVRTITEQHSDEAGRMIALVLDPQLEYELRNSLSRESDGEALMLAPDRAMDLTRQVAEAWQNAMEAGHDKVVLLCDYRIRPHLAGLLSRQLPQLPVIAYDEVANSAKIESIGTINLAPVGAEAISSGS